VPATHCREIAKLALEGGDVSQGLELLVIVVTVHRASGTKLAIGLGHGERGEGLKKEEGREKEGTSKQFFRQWGSI